MLASFIGSLSFVSIDVGHPSLAHLRLQREVDMVKEGPFDNLRPSRAYPFFI